MRWTVGEWPEDGACPDLVREEWLAQEIAAIQPPVDLALLLTCLLEAAEPSPEEVAELERCLLRWITPR